MRKHMRMFLLLIAALVLSACGGGETSGDPLGTDSITVKAEPATVGAGQESVITATVARFNENPAIERSVTFTFRTNNSGGTLRAVNNRVDGQNQARAVYTAGWNAPGAEISDTIQASLPNGAGAVVVITRAGNGIAEITAEPAEVEANQSSVVTVFVSDSSDKPISGATVFFSIPVANSGSPALTAYSAFTDGLGRATTVYTPGIASPDQTVSDTVEARLSNGSSRSVVITRTGEAVEPVEPTEPLAISVAAVPTSVSAGGLSIITATLAGDNKSGVRVAFSLPVNNSGATLSSSTAVTDGAGKAVVTYQAGGNNPTADVQDTVRAVVGSISSTAAITRTGSTTKTYSISLLGQTLFSVLQGETISDVLTATVSDSSFNLVSGMTVTFSIVSGGGALTSATAFTGGDGKATVVYSRTMTEPKGSTNYSVLKARLPDGTETLLTIAIYVSLL